MNDNNVRLPEPGKCCFIFNEKCCNIVLGCLNAFLSLVLLMIMTISAFTTVSYPVSDEKDPNFASQLLRVQVTSFVLVFILLAKFLYDVFFIYAIAKERSRIIRSYAFVWIAFFIMALTTFFVGSAKHSFVSTFLEIFYACLNFYMILVTCCCYKLQNIPIPGI